MTTSCSTNFDPDIGESLAAYATPCIAGEIKRHFRDRRWQVHVRRSAQEPRLEIRKARGDLAQQLSRTPTPARRGGTPAEQRRAAAGTRLPG